MNHQRAEYPQATVADLAAMRQFLAQAAAAVTDDGELVQELVLAVNEALTNILEHGFKDRPGYLSISVTCHDSALVVELRDDAPPFDPTRVPTPNVTLPLAQRPSGGLGVHMMRELMDRLVYTRTASGQNRLTLVKKCGVAGEETNNEDTS